MDFYKRTFSAIVLLFLLSYGHPSYPSDPFNYGVLWNSFSKDVRLVYLKGFKDGIGHAYHTALFTWIGPEEAWKKPESERVKAVREAIFVMFDVDAVSVVMTELYKDPVNTFIDFLSMVYLARDKLQGEDIEKRLREKRNTAMLIHRYEQENKPK